MSQQSNQWVNNLGKVKKSKKGGHYIEMEKDITLKQGDIINLKPFVDEINGLVKKGFINEDEAAKRIENQSFIKYVLNLTPRKED